MDGRWHWSAHLCHAVSTCVCCIHCTLLVAYCCISRQRLHWHCHAIQRRKHVDKALMFLLANVLRIRARAAHRACIGVSLAAGCVCR